MFNFYFIFCWLFFSAAYFILLFLLFAWSVFCQAAIVSAVCHTLCCCCCCYCCHCLFFFFYLCFYFFCIIWPISAAARLVESVFFVVSLFCFASLCLNLFCSFARCTLHANWQQQSNPSLSCTTPPTLLVLSPCSQWCHLACSGAILCASHLTNTRKLFTNNWQSINRLASHPLLLARTH